MKKSLLFVTLLFAMTVVMGQTMPRKMVALEIGTGTWCQFCPGAAMGADDLLSNGCFVAVIENHNGDPYTNAYSNARNAYYGISGYPTAVFDGVLKVVGGSHTNSMYGSYLPKYSSRIVKPSDCDLSMEVSNSGLDYTVVITVTKLGSWSGATPVLQFAVTQSNIQFNWQGMTHLEHVNRLMVPDANGTVVDFTSGNVQTYTLNFTMDAAWPLEDCEFIAFIQDNTGKEVHQAIKRGVIDLNVDFTASATQIPNNTVVNFTNNTTGGYIGVPETYQWWFPGATPAVDTAKNPTVTYTECGAHDVTLIVNRGGQIDTLAKSLYIAVGTVVNVAITPDDTACWYQPITIDCTTPGATYLWAPGGETTPSITVAYPQYGYGTHTFSCTVSTPDGCVQTKYMTIFIDACTGINEKDNSMSATIYPNPNNGNFNLELKSGNSRSVNISIINAIGNKVYEETGVIVNGTNVKNLNLGNLNKGIYFVTIQSGDNKIVQKLLVK